MRRGPGINADLTYDSTTSQYKLKWFDESIFTFDSAGKLVNTKDKNGNQLSFTYRLTQGGRHTAGPGETVGERGILFWNTLLAEIQQINGDAEGYNAVGWSLRSIALRGPPATSATFAPTRIRTACSAASTPSWWWTIA